MNEGSDTEECLVHVYMVQVNKVLYQLLKSAGGGYDYGINAYLRRRLGKAEPVYAVCSDDCLDDESDGDAPDVELFKAIPVSQAPRVPPYSVPIEGDLYDVLIEDTATPEKKIICFLEEMAAEINQSQSRSR
jgi:hypothetical protein